MAAPARRGAREALPGLIEQEMLRPFEWWVSDCLTAIDAVLVRGGFASIAAPFRGRYRDADEAKAVGPVEDRAAETFAGLGWPEVDPGAPEPWDLGVWGNSLMIWDGAYWCGKSEDGYRMKPRVRRAWRPQA